MPNLNFTVEESNLIAIYKEETWGATIANIAAALPYMDEDIRTIAEYGISKLAELTETEFTELSFSMTDDLDEGGEHE